MSSKQQHMQTHQTEKLIEEMLDFLESSSEGEEDAVKIYARKDEVADQKKTTNGKAFETTIAQELRKWNQQQFAEEINKTNALNHKKSISLPQSPTCSRENIWNHTSDCSFNQSSILCNNTVNSEQPKSPNIATIDNGLQAKFQKIYRNSRYNDDKHKLFVQQVRQAIHGNTNGHPAFGSKEYYEAAQNYAISGYDLYDFPQNLQMCLNNQLPGFGHQVNAYNGLYSKTFQASQTPQANVQQNVGPISNNNIGKTQGYNTTSTNLEYGVQQKIHNNLQSEAYPAVAANMIATNSSPSYPNGYGKPTNVITTSVSSSTNCYPQTITQPPANFIPNSLANAALANSPAILYSNPMAAASATSQQHMNANNKHAIYERLAYAQMWQQQICYQQQVYYQQQKQRVVAALLQQKSKACASAAAAAGQVMSSVPAVTLKQKLEPFIAAKAAEELKLLTETVDGTAAVPTFDKQNFPPLKTTSPTKYDAILDNNSSASMVVNNEVE